MARRARHREPLRVAVMCGATDGGAWIVPICTGLRDRGYDVMAIIGYPEDTLAARLREARVNYVAMSQPFPGTSPIVNALARIPYMYWLRFVSYTVAYARTVLRVAALLRRKRIDVIQTHVITTTLVGRVAAYLARVPIRTAMVPGPYHLESDLFRKPDLATTWMEHRLIGGSKIVHDLYAQYGVPARKRTYSYYGSDERRFDPNRARPERVRESLGLSAETPLIGQIAYFYAVVDGPTAPAAVRGRGVKGHEDFVDAAKLVLERRPDARFVLVGSGWGPPGEEHRLEIVERVRRLGLDEHVIFAGRRDDIPDVLAALDVSVQCSLAENLGGTIESLLMEAPTIATRVGGMPEAVRHEATGLLVEPRAPEQLAAAMLRLIEDRELGRRLGRAGRRLMLERFTIKRTVQDIDGVFRAVARERGIERPPVVS